MEDDAPALAVEPLGAPTDPLRPTGRVEAYPASADRRPDDSAWRGALLAMVGLVIWLPMFWVLVLLGELVGTRFLDADAPILLGLAALGCVAFLAAVGVHAVRRRARRLLAGFVWTLAGVLILGFLVFRFLSSIFVW